MSIVEMNKSLKVGYMSSVLLFFGILLSGPIGFLLVTFLKPQPPWVDATTFARNFHPFQVIPYIFGFLIVAGSIFLVNSLAGNYTENISRRRLNSAKMWAYLFGVVICFNYISQTILVPALIHNDYVKYGKYIETLSMSNPGSLGWLLEMCGYAFLGFALWAIAPYFRYGRHGRGVYSLIIINGVASFLSAVATIFSRGWLFTTFGIVSFLFWNLLMLVIAAEMSFSLKAGIADHK